MLEFLVPEAHAESVHAMLFRDLLNGVPLLGPALEEVSKRLAFLMDKIIKVPRAARALVGDREVPDKDRLQVTPLMFVVFRQAVEPGPC